VITADVSTRSRPDLQVPRYCACGCGERLKSRWYLTRFRPGHYSRTKTPKRYRWDGEARAHRVRAERALGKPLPRGVQVHHAKGIHDNDHLVICQDAAYHKLLHARMRIVAAGGNPNTEKICGKCRQVKPRTAFPIKRAAVDGLYTRCIDCSRTERQARWQREKAAR